MHTHSWRCKAKSSGHIGFADRIACLALLRKWPFHGLCPWHSLNLPTPSDKNGEHRSRGTGGDTHIYRNPSIIYQEIAYHQIPGNPLSSDTRKSPIIRYQGFPYHQKLPGSWANIRNSRIPAPRTPTCTKPIESIKKNHMLRYKTCG